MIHTLKFACPIALIHCIQKQTMLVIHVRRSETKAKGVSRKFLQGYPDRNPHSRIVYEHANGLAISTPPFFLGAFQFGVFCLLVVTDAVLD